MSKFNMKQKTLEMETDPLTLRMIAAKRPLKCDTCNSFVNNLNAKPAKKSYCTKYESMIDMVGCMNHSHKLKNRLLEQTRFSINGIDGEWK
jgi:hypothetical protein